MAFLDLVFNLPKNDRTISFTQIAQKTKQDVKEIEFLLIRCMAYGLVKGMINEIKQQVTISWMIPRILDNQRIEVMKNKFNEWSFVMKNLIQVVEQQASPIY
ncbi:26S proteasome protein, macropain, putative [Ichthyophthirius multifiliis]|uniref:26S proteasome protein, macropain, putative n=1 Tax=Ichthyophthirius multifiliis TaxID=5932 RepID=G0QYX9_ICHMU|nr:26S proteasome protein, macropain, putative [Ichthyophthirius multifiliis]EGR29550.1 26S proteasome protein, macropain, putative [Ichthyophthirius multifiliis]|eukprot:XP_004030786.1 26S proteasome protein, macropain, putative [Ichthyophthirius multifiliis]